MLFCSMLLEGLIFCSHRQAGVHAADIVSTGSVFNPCVLTSPENTAVTAWPSEQAEKFTSKAGSYFRTQLI